MTILFLILIIIASFILGLIVLIQNPKGGGLAGNIAGFSNQFMGVKQTTDVLEKGTWVFAAVIGVLCLVSVMFMDRDAAGPNVSSKGQGAPIPASGAPAQAPATPNNTLTLPGDTNNK